MAYDYLTNGWLTNTSPIWYTFQLLITVLLFLSVYQKETVHAVVTDNKDKKDRQDCSSEETNVCNSV